MEKIVFLSDLELPGESDFAKKFNKMHDLWQRYKETEDQYDYDNWFNYKLQLEMGML